MTSTIRSAARLAAMLTITLLTAGSAAAQQDVITSPSFSTYYSVPDPNFPEGAEEVDGHGEGVIELPYATRARIVGRVAVTGDARSVFHAITIRIGGRTFALPPPGMVGEPLAPPWELVFGTGRVAPLEFEGGEVDLAASTPVSIDFTGDPYHYGGNFYDFMSVSVTFFIDNKAIVRVSGPPWIPLGSSAQVTYESTPSGGVASEWALPVGEDVATITPTGLLTAKSSPDMLKVSVRYDLVPGESIPTIDPGSSSSQLIVLGTHVGESGEFEEPIPALTLTVSPPSGPYPLGSPITVTASHWNGFGTVDWWNLTSGALLATTSGPSFTFPYFGQFELLTIYGADSGNFVYGHSSPEFVNLYGSTPIGAELREDLVAGAGQSGQAGHPLAEPFVVRVYDSATGQPAPGVEVRFSVDDQPIGAGATFVESGGGVLVVTTDSDGLARGTLRLGSAAGLYTVTADSPRAVGSNTFLASAVAFRLLQPADTYVVAELATHSVQLEVEADPAGGTTSGWVSLDPTYATVDAEGRVRGVTRDGTARIQATHTFLDGSTATATVEVFVHGVSEILQTPGGIRPAGSVVHFEVFATSGPPWAYQWFVNGQMIPGATDPSIDAVVFEAAVVSVAVGTTEFGGFLLSLGYAVSPAEIPLREGEGNVTEGTGDGASGSGVCTVLHHNGENRITRTDLVIQGRGECHFALSRRYRSRIEWTGELGHNWDSNLFEKLVVDPSTGDVQRVDMGRAETWTRTGSSFVAPPGFFGTLVQRADGTYVLREPDGSRRAFRADGLLLRWEDRSGNRILFERDETTKQLTRALDAYDRPIAFSFEAGRLASVTDFAGREVRYGYEDGHLVSARTPVVTGTPTGDDFPAGRTELYAYTSDRADSRLAHNLASITLPQEAATGGTSYYAWTYEEDPSDPFLFDRVATQRLGGTNASGVPAGGTYVFTYERLNAGAPAGDPTIQRTKTTVVDRVGNTVEHFANENGDELLRRVLTRGLRPDDPAAFETRSVYDADGTLLERTFPEGNVLRLTYAAGPRAARRNVTEVRLVAGPRGGDADLVTRMTYEPLCQRLASITDPRGTAPFTAPLGSWSAERYTSRMLFDYQEGSAPVADAIEFGIDLSGMDRGLGDLNGDGRTDQVQGHVVRTQAPSVALRPESLEAERLGTTTQAVLTDTAWNDHGQPVSIVDAEGNVTDLVYHPQSDPDGDGVADSSLPADASGYLAAVLRDARTSPRRRTIAPPLRLETRLSYDRLGHVTGVQDPRGVVTRVDVNVLGEVLQVTRGDDVGVAVMSGQLVTGEAPLRYRARFFHDFNGRVVRTEVENRDGIVPGVGPWIEREVEHDILGHPVETHAELDGTTWVTTRLRYDANESLRLVERPDGQRTAFERDERGLVLRVTRGEGSPAASMVEVSYDRNGNQRRVLDAEDTDHDGEREATTFAYDGFDRLVQIVDALQNQVFVEHDVASQVVRKVVLGHPAGNPTGAQVLLADARFDHDELGRVFQTHAALFLAGQLPAQRPVTLSDQDGDGLVTTLLEHDALSRTWAVVEDDLQVSRSVFDGASRVVESIDALGNRRVVTHDRSGNPLAVTSVELATVPGVASESFTTRYVWDQLGRLARVSDNAGQTAYFTYDSRDQLVQRADPQGLAIADPLGVVPTGVNAPGNTTRWVHDGLGRVLTETHDLRVGGQGGAPLDLTNLANPDGQVTLAYVWDQSSRLRAIVDDAGRTTTMDYDVLDRKTTHTYADGSSARFTFDADDNVTSIVDPNGSVITRAHDALNRLVQVDVSRAPGVGGTTRETYAHDGLGRVVRMTDDNGGLAPSVVERTFDSLSRLVEERQGGQAISSTHAGDGKRTSVTYPGGRTIGYHHDALDRVQRITDGAGPGGSLIAEHGWIGPGHRPLFRRSANGTALTMLDDLGQTDVGYDAVQRVTRLRHVGPGGQIFVDRVHGYDRASNRTFEQRLDDGGLTDRYAYDSTYRVTASFFDEAGPAGGDPAPGVARRELAASAYRYDGVGNRVQVTEDRLVARPPVPGGGKAAIHARERVDLGEQSRVEGDVLVDETRDHGWCRYGHGRHGRGRDDGRGRHDDDDGRGRRRGQESSATLDDRAVVQGDVVAERVELKRQARVEGDVETDDLRRGQGSVVTGAVRDYATPDPAVQDVARVNPGRTDFTSRFNQVVTLQPGRYDDVRILAGSRLILPGGTYELSTLHLGLGAVVEVRGPVVVRVASTLQLLHGVRVLPAAGLTTAQARWETTDRSVLLGNDVQFFGELAAPEARVDIGREARIRGAIEAERVVVGDCAQVIGPPSGPGSPGSVDRVQRLVAYGVNSLNQYTTVGGVARSHDRSGNLIDDGVRRLTWDYRNRLVAVADKAGGRPIAAYSYACGNRRAGKTTYTAAGGIDRVTRSFWDGWDLIEEQSATGATEATYVSGVGIDEHLQVVRTSASPLGAAALWCAQDARGDVVAVTNASGAVVERSKFDDFGRQTGGGTQPHGFQGRYRDAETGWVYFRHRFYDPETGRFLGRDRAADAANLGNLYTFAGNRPISARDPSGDLLFIPILIIVAKAAAVGAGTAAVGTLAADSIAREWTDNGDWYRPDAMTAREVGKATVIGAVSGAAGGVVVGRAGSAAINSIRTLAVSGAVGGVTGQAATDAFNGCLSSAGTYARAAGAGAVLGVLGGKAAERFTQGSPSGVSSSFPDGAPQGRPAPAVLEGEARNIFLKSLVRTEEGRGALATFVTQMDDASLLFLPSTPTRSFGYTKRLPDGSAVVIVPTRNPRTNAPRDIGDLERSFVHEMDHVAEHALAAERGLPMPRESVAAEIAAETRALRHLQELRDGSPDLPSGGGPTPEATRALYPNASDQ